MTIDASFFGSALRPGSQIHFQLWYRDPASAGSAFNLSDAVSVSFL